MSKPLKSDFFSLTPDRVLDAIEGSLKVRATGRAFALNSMENRVYEIELEDGTSVVAKFYRPGRWSSEQILEEHRFLAALLEAEIPVVAPLKLQESPASRCVQSGTSTLASLKSGIYFAVFPKVKGRLIDEFTATKLETIGRYVARLHSLGSRFEMKHRMPLNVETFGYKPAEFILNSDFVDENYINHYERTVSNFLQIAEPLLKDATSFALHGDCHLGNVLWNIEAPFFLDFDDMTLAPPVQDIWMIIRGRDEQAIEQRDQLLKAYDQMYSFDRSTLKLIEPLRGLRMIHYSGWIAQRWDDPSFPRAFPSFGTPKYWNEELEAINEITALIEENS